jgi:D-psicose/D-tagatose/L-ribulose 3-epimerase
MNPNRRHLLKLLALGFAVPAWASVANYQFGVTAITSKFADAVKYGFDYFEPSACEVANMDDDAFARFRDQVLASPIRCSSLNLFTSPPGDFPNLPTLYVVGQNVNMEQLHDYVSKALARCKQLGAECVVWGSAESRKVPEGYSRDKAWEQIRDFLRMCDPIARSHGIVIAIEPIRTPACNILTTGAEVLKMVHAVDRPNVKMIIDYYQMSSMNESSDIIWTARKDIVHFHFGRGSRGWPTLQDEEPGYGPFFSEIKKIGYHGGISIEGRGSIERDTAACLAFFRAHLA